MAFIVDAIDRQIDRLEARKQEVLRLAAVVDLPEGSVIQFKKRFTAGPRRTYTYTMVKAAGMWYSTGLVRGSHRVTASGLVDFLGDVKKVRVVKEWERAI